MSPASRSKSKDKRAASKEPQKSSTKPTPNANTGGGIPASGYNPLLGTFHTLETAPASSAPPVHVNGRFRNIDETEDPSGNSVDEYDSVSNNGSCSGESEDPKDKTSQGPSRQEEAAAPGVDSDKREKIRQKNEKKHQRQKERRAQELHERCSGFLMSRKLESLAQQLVAMGFPSERATMALILNEGRIEESVAWLFEGGEDTDNQRERSLDGGGGGNGNGNVKVDISEELARIAAMEIKFKCSKQEVERAVVACEGDLQQAAETLMKTQKPESPGGDPPTIGGSGKPSVTNSRSSSASRVPSKCMPIQQKTDDRDFNYTKMAVPVPVGRISTEPGAKNIQLLKKTQPNSDWAKPQPPAAPLRWPVGGSKSNPSVSYSLASLLQAAPPPPSKTEAVGNELKNLQLGSVREPVIVMQRPQSKHIPATADWNSGGGGGEQVTGMNPNGLSHIATAATRGFNTSSYGSNTNSQMYNQFPYHHHQLPPPPLPQQHYVSNGGLFDSHGGQPGGMNHLGNNGMWNRAAGLTPTLAAASSLGLFSGGASGMSHVDWNADGVSQFDYTNIDWSLNRLPTPSGSSRPNGLWVGSQAGAVLSNGLHPDGAAAGSEPSGGSGSREWSSPFEEKDLFSLPRQFVSSPSL